MARVRGQLARAPAELKLADAQHVVAREAGYPTWVRLKLHLTQLRQSRAQLIDSTLEAAVRGDRQAVDSALAIAEDLANASLHLAAALADEAAVARRLAHTPPEAVRVAHGPLAGSPLAYLCSARLGSDERDVQRSRANIATLLLQRGADPNECLDALDAPGGMLSVLHLAARHTTSPELVAVLLSAGAVLEPPGSTAGPPAPPLVGAALGGNLACVQALLDAGAPRWQAREALEVALERDDRELAKALLSHGCLPDEAGRWRGRDGGCLHAALSLGRDASFVELLLDGGASVATRDRDGRTPLAIAVQLARADAAALFRRRGASDDELRATDSLIGACFAGDRARVQELSRAEPKLLEQCSSSDHQNVCRALRLGNVTALGLLLEAGFEPHVVDDDGETALHLAVRSGDVSSVTLLLARGASPDVPNYENLTARALVRLEEDPERRSALARAFARFAPKKSEPADASAADEIDADHERAQLEARRDELAAHFEEALDKMAAGDVTGLRRLLQRRPALVTARSHRFHRATLLHYLGNNGTERTVAPPNAAAIAELLVEHGAAVDASCHMYGGGPHQSTLGLVATTDASVYADGVQAALLAALVRGGARLHEADGRSRALEGAISYGAVPALRSLVALGASAYDLVTAAALGDLPLLEARLAGASRDERATAFASAAQFGRVEALERLLRAGAELEAEGGFAGTALHKAAAANAVDSVRWLLAQGANPEARDRAYQGTPADWARQFGSQEALAVLEGTHGRPGSA